MGIQGMRASVRICCYLYSFVPCTLQIETGGIAEREGAEQLRTEAQSKQHKLRDAHSEPTDQGMYNTRCIATARLLLPPFHFDLDLGDPLPQPANNPKSLISSVRTTSSNTLLASLAPDSSLSPLPSLRTGKLTVRTRSAFLLGMRHRAKRMRTSSASSAGRLNFETV